jgi:hypothetical protein
MLPETWTDYLDDANNGPGWIWRGLLAPRSARALNTFELLQRNGIGSANT